MSQAPQRPETSPGSGRWRKIAREVAIVALIVLGVRAYQLRDAAAGSAPAFTRQSLSGTELRVPDGSGEPTLVYFWATWCGTCSAMRGNVEALAGAHRVISVASRSGSAEQVAAYARAERVAYPIVVDDEDELRSAYGVRAFPTTFVLDGDGHIDHVEVGYTTELGLLARLWLARLL